jgi:hypothetical protein
VLCCVLALLFVMWSWRISGLIILIQKKFTVPVWSIEIFNIQYMYYGNLF